MLVVMYMLTAYLQCTIIGPESGGVMALTLLMKRSSGVGWSGTP